MDKNEIANILEEIAILLELKGENPFKVRAFQNASRTIETLSENIEVLVKEKRLTSFKGIGEGIAGVITDLVTKGKSKEYEALKKGLPEGLFEMLKIPGLGPKKVKKLYDVLHIKSVGELEYACKENRLLKLEGFGEKTQSKILEGIGHFKKFQGQFLFPHAYFEALQVVDILKKNKNVKRIEIAGSLRRKKELVKDIDILISSPRCGDVMDAFVKMKMVKNVVAQGETKSSIHLTSGIQVDVRCVKDEEFPYALQHFSGSKEHNTALRSLAKKKGFKMNEYGLFKGNKNTPCTSEEDIYKKLGLSFIPPELRENMGEIEAALKGTLPELVSFKDIKGVFHVHTDMSDGNASLEEMIKACEELGFEYVGISDHSQSAVYAHGLKPKDVKEQHKLIDKLNKKLKNMTILKGIESDILKDGSLDYKNDVLSSFDFVIGSIHSQFNMPEKDMTKRLTKALQNKYLTMIGHPTGRLILGRKGYQVNVKELINTASQEGKILETNANPHRFDLDWRWGQYLKEKKVLTSINPDAHSKEGLKDYVLGVGIARKAWLEKKDILNTKSLKEVMKYLDVK
ncbi:MAG: DNA polymerase/3'-5' exonuclease PolX [Deltaproteobacteria bacterium]|nr:DNA polymerase/3'-5' exonuclease PolX [Deltaproteobacteria bacterium]